MTRILYVEDNDDNVYMLKMRLEMIDGFEVLVAENGEVGCATALAERPDLILMDLDLPVVDGWAGPVARTPSPAALGPRAPTIPSTWRSRSHRRK